MLPPLSYVVPLALSVAVVAAAVSLLPGLISILLNSRSLLTPRMVFVVYLSFSLLVTVALMVLNAEDTRRFEICGTILFSGFIASAALGCWIRRMRDRQLRIPERGQ